MNETGKTYGGEEKYERNFPDAVNTLVYNLVLQILKLNIQYIMSAFL